MTRRAAAARLLAPVLALIVAFGMLGLPATAAADGDPASDVLLGESVFYPYSPPVASSVQAQLNAATAAAKTAGFPIKVALIAAPTDLGVLPSLFGKPQTYAEFLDKEISFHGPQPLLVVMANGYGTAGMKASTASAVTPLSKPAGKTSTAIAQAAIAAVSALATADGHPLAKAIAPKSTKAPARSGGGGSTGLLIGLIAAAVLVAGALIAVRARKASASRP